MGVILQNPLGVRDAHLAQHVRGVAAGLLLGLVGMEADGLHHLPVNAHGGVQGAHGLLKDHAHPAATDGADLRVRGRQQVHAVQNGMAVGHLARGVLQKAHNGEARHALAAAGLAHQTQNLPLIDVEGDLIHGRDAALLAGEELRAQLVYLQQYFFLHIESPFPILPVT